MKGKFGSLFRFFSVLSLGFALTGCATVRGAQDRVPALVGSPDLIPVNTALQNFYMPLDSARLGMNRRDYRDFIIGIYLSAVDGKYKSFTDQLQSSDRGSALGLDLLLLGLTGATALVGPSATDELATITAVASGARASIDKRLFFDRTLPAVIASMDAERAAIKADIARMRTLPVEQYDLASAMNDVNRLQQAGRLDQAVARMTQVAQTDRVAEEQRLHNIVAACDASTAGAAELNEKFRHLMMDDLSKSASRLSLAAKELNITIPVGAVPSWRMVAPAFDAQFCDDDKKEQFINRMETLIAAL